jgi:hypothetical protein
MIVAPSMGPTAAQVRPRLTMSIVSGSMFPREAARTLPFEFSRS